MYHGYFEGKKDCSTYLDRIIDDKVFNLNAYRKNNEDLKNLSDEELLDHYLNIGKYENRLCKFIVNDFKNINLLTLHNYDPIIYRNNYQDLKNFNEIELERSFY